ncbi:hypothetical protein EYC84_001306 [Monilinia fructicola]|uniref:Uncharacterized protein n=1 Tax=Monilinia fructicola TaxID=38448 RepID=A0A5M9JNZ4_MONFR|nr:hypothetical protein EYC84_001306 [Monilinia fructicola]
MTTFAKGKKVFKPNRHARAEQSRRREVGQRPPRSASAEAALRAAKDRAVQNGTIVLVRRPKVLTAEEKAEKEAKKKRKRKEKREEEKKEKEEKEEREKGERERERLFAAASTSQHLARDELLVEQFPGLRIAGGVPRRVAEARGFLSLPLVHLGRERR